MKQPRRLQFDLANPPRSLCWQGDGLVDVVDGGVRYELDGQETSSNIRYSYRFDAGIVSPSGRYAAVYEQLGTKALILKGRKVHREINRSYYQADAYQYPITFFTARDGRDYIVHCPDEYNRLEIEDAETGVRIASAASRQLVDVFHSRLAVSFDGSMLLSAGWVWHPWDIAFLVDLRASQGDAAQLDRRVALPEEINDYEVVSASFTPENRIVLAMFSEEEERHQLMQLTPDGLLVTHSAPTNVPLGTIMPIGENYTLSLNEHPKLHSNASGVVVAEFHELPTGKQVSSIIRGAEPVPPTAIDVAGKRIAIAVERTIHILDFSDVTAH